jgi:hypothetical protein
MVGSKFMAISNRYSGLDRRDLRLTEYRFHIYSKVNDVRKLFYNFEGDPWSDQKLGSFRTGTLVWSDEYSASPRSDSTSTPRKPASGNSCKNLMAIKRSDQKLGPCRTSSLVWSDETSASPTSDSTSTPRKPASENSC